MQQDDRTAEAAKLRPVTDRYVRRGGEISPRIYPGTLKALEEAINDMAVESTHNPDQVYYLESVNKGERKVIRTYKGGLPWQAVK